jgi:hypothetical protein
MAVEHTESAWRDKPYSVALAVFKAQWQVMGRMSFQVLISRSI